jgi:RNAse (barnase) inhibitor barstar
MNLELSKEDLDIIEELLSIEMNSLPVEIHHCRTADYKDMLKMKQKTVSGLLERVKQLH